MSVSYFYRKNWFQNPSLLLVTFQWFLFFGVRMVGMFGGSWMGHEKWGAWMLVKWFKDANRRRTNVTAVAFYYFVKSFLWPLAWQSVVIKIKHLTTNRRQVWLLILLYSWWFYQQWFWSGMIRQKSPAITNSCTLKNAEKNRSSQGL